MSVKQNFEIPSLPSNRHIFARLSFEQAIYAVAAIILLKDEGRWGEISPSSSPPGRNSALTVASLRR